MRDLIFGFFTAFKLLNFRLDDFTLEVRRFFAGLFGFEEFAPVDVGLLVIFACFVSH